VSWVGAERDFGRYVKNHVSTWFDVLFRGHGFLFLMYQQHICNYGSAEFVGLCFFRCAAHELGRSTFKHTCIHLVLTNALKVRTHKGQHTHT
jgi:hypothetical protein